MLPQANATLLQITAAATTGEWDSAPIDGAPTWMGYTRIYVSEAQRVVRKGAELDEITMRTAFLPASLPVPVEGESLSIELDRGGVQTHRVESVTLAQMGHIRAPMRVVLRAT